MVAIIDFGRAFYTQVAFQNGAREGARFGSVHPAWVVAADNANPNNIQSRAQTEASAGTATPTVVVKCITSASVTSTAPSAAYTACAKSGNRVEVSVNATFQPATPIISSFFPSGLPMSGTTRMTIE